MDKKYRFLAAVSVFVFLILANISLISALGITPGRISLDYKGGQEQEITLDVLNNKNKDMKTSIYVQGELNDSIILSRNLMEFNFDEERKQLKYKIKLPDRLAKEPGLHVAEIVVMEIPKTDEESGTFVGATVAVVSQLFVYVPCPGKCIDIDLSVVNAEQNSTATFVVPIINRGKLGINDAKATIDIYNLKNEKIASIESDSSSVIAGARAELVAKWFVNATPGNYLAKVRVFYDGESKDFEKEFELGKESLAIDRIFVNDFRLGEIVKLSISVENKWDEEFKTVFANLLVYDYKEHSVADIKSSTESVPALSKKELIAFWYTMVVQEGEYRGKLLVKYDKKSTDRDLVLKITQNNMDIQGVGYVIGSAKSGSTISIKEVILIFVIILILINVLWFVFWRRLVARRKK